METAIVVLVPEAEPIVGSWRQRYAYQAAIGMPSHVTLMYPFLDETTAEIEDALVSLCAQCQAFDVSFHRCARFDDDVLFLEPEPDDGFRRLIRSIAHHFGVLPYEGAIPLDEVKPHLSVVDAVHTDADGEVLDAATRDVEPHLPFATRVESVALMRRDARWEVVRSFPLGVA